ncbi:hypothetical protein ASPZODRAFT_894328 [Penicilliopsis zonata CBS 506.65]|uniref:BHLH domain-containing protein n=1 Tax=Penicilliopsis zonata CBS 506.65 TaxID=1073090 RepID=A0A1L9S8L6_9EURO|nr:hypothetical protein ASPZODRAFT_894328 [Penicilliopsis zonata CBS 506.65]OJJ43502.1 hypothetical protein ASPZODRAFT_894328 [Penicilliopsis zonata CBS 506.65]
MMPFADPKCLEMNSLSLVGDIPVNAGPWSNNDWANWNIVSPDSPTLAPFQQELIFPFSPDPFGPIMFGVRGIAGTVNKLTTDDTSGSASVEENSLPPSPVKEIQPSNRQAQTRAPSGLGGDDADDEDEQHNQQLQESLRRRQAHNIVEKNYRHSVHSKFIHLREILNQCNGPGDIHMSNSRRAQRPNTLQEACDTILDLQRQVKSLKKELSTLCEATLPAETYKYTLHDE